MYKIATGERRLGSDSFIENGGVMILLAGCLAVCFVILAILFVVGKYSAGIQKAYSLMKNKLMWNALIRYQF